MSPLSSGRAGRQRPFSRILSRAALWVCLAFGLSACDRLARPGEGRGGRAEPKPAALQQAQDRVQKQNGTAYIPIDDTAFLIPEKTWLKGYSRKMTDGTVGSISLHATVPDVQPWSQARNEEMYWPAGPGKKLAIDIKGGEVGAYRDHFHEVPHSRMWQSQFIEEPSDQATQGLRQFRQLWTFYKDEKAEQEAVRRWGKDFVEERRRDAGKPMTDTVYYEFIESDRVKYFIRCSDGLSPGQIWLSCHLSFPWARTLMVEVEFNRDHITDIVAMADKLSERLREFEAAGLAFRATQSPSDSTTKRP